MITERKGIGIITDNEESYISLLEGAVSAVDEYSRMVITRFSFDFHFRIVPSEGVFLNDIVKEVLKVNNLVGIKVEMSKSVKSTAAIEFLIPIFAESKNHNYFKNNTENKMDV